VVALRTQGKDDEAKEWRPTRSFFSTAITRFKAAYGASQEGWAQQRFEIGEAYLKMVRTGKA